MYILVNVDENHLDRFHNFCVIYYGFLSLWVQYIIVSCIYGIAQESIQWDKRQKAQLKFIQCFFLSTMFKRNMLKWIIRTESCNCTRLWIRPKWFSPTGSKTDRIKSFKMLLVANDQCYTYLYFIIHRGQKCIFFSVPILTQSHLAHLRAFGTNHFHHVPCSLNNCRTWHLVCLCQYLTVGVVNKYKGGWCCLSFFLFSIVINHINVHDELPHLVSRNQQCKQQQRSAQAVLQDMTSRK